MLSRLRREIEKDKFHLQASQGYPITRTPYVPPIMASVADTKILKGSTAMLKIFYAKEGSDLVKAKSLEFIRQYLMTHMKVFPAIHQGLKDSPLPCNTIAVTFTWHNFNVGDSCTEFIPTEGEWKSGYFTYQRLSENLQSTHLNLDGTQYLAGLCYYPVLHGMPKMLKLDRKLMNLASAGVEIYPSQNRTYADSYYMKHVYGRYCETAGKRVVVNFADEKRGVCHQEIDFTKKNACKFTKCEECAEEKRTYKWVRPGKVATAIPPAPKIEVPPTPNDDAEMLSLLKSSKIGLPELKALISDAHTPVSPVLIPQPSEFSHFSNDSRSASVDDLGKHLENLDAMLDELRKLQENLHNDSKSDEEAQVYSSKSPKLSESTVTSKSDLFEEQLPESARLSKAMSMETGVAEPSEEVETVKDDTQSTTSFLSRPLFPVLINQSSEFSNFSKDQRSASVIDLDEHLEKMDDMLDDFQMLQEDLNSDSKSDEEVQANSSASSTESLMSDFENVEDGITDIDSDIDAEIVY